MAQWYRFGLIGWVKGCEGDKCKVVKENKDLRLEIVKLREQLLQMNSIKQENKRLNNIIDEFEKWLDEKSNEYRSYYEHDKADTLDIASYKIKELKGDNKEC